MKTLCADRTAIFEPLHDAMSLYAPRLRGGGAVWLPLAEQGLDVAQSYTQARRIVASRS